MNKHGYKFYNEYLGKEVFIELPDGSESLSDGDIRSIVRGLAVVTSEATSLSDLRKLFTNILEPIFKNLNSKIEELSDQNSRDRLNQLFFEQMRELKKQKIYPMPTPPWEQQNNYCSKCGLELGQVMMYSCPNSDCPAGLGPVMCSSEGC